MRQTEALPVLAGTQRVEPSPTTENICLFSKLMTILYFPPMKMVPPVNAKSLFPAKIIIPAFFVAARRRAAGSWARWWATSTAGCATARPTRARANGSPTCAAGGSTGPSFAHPASSQTPGAQTTAPSELRASEVSHTVFVSGRKELYEKVVFVFRTKCSCFLFSSFASVPITKGEKKHILGGGVGRGVNCVVKFIVPFRSKKSTIA